MIPVLYYLVKVGVCSGILFLYYHLLLRNKIFHQWNRFYLLGAVIISLLLPALQFTIEKTSSDDTGSAIEILQVVQTADQFVADIETTSAPGITAEQWVGYLYLLVCFLLFIILLRSLYTVARIVMSHEVQVVEDVKFVETAVKGTPFSFFQYIFWNKDIDLQTETGRQIFKHELVHVKERHTLDKIFLQIVLIFFWMNPFFWLIRRELRMIHEFIADKKAVGEYGASALASMILTAVYPRHSFTIANHFFQSSIKRRLHMLKKIQNPRLNYLSRILALPFLALIALAFTLKPKNISTSIPETNLEKEFVVVIDAGHGLHDKGAQVEGVLEKDITLKIASLVRSLNKNEKIRIVLTRTGDSYPTLKDRVQFTKDQKADLFISIHVNAAVDASGKHIPDSSGIEMYVSKKEGEQQMASLLLASALLKDIGSIYKVYPSIKKSGVWVLDQSPCASVMVELGYLTNPGDRKFIAITSNQELIAEKILYSIERFASLVQGGSTLNGSMNVDLSNEKEILFSVDTTPEKAEVKPGKIKVNGKPIGAGESAWKGPIYINDKLFKGEHKDIPLAPGDIESTTVLKGEHHVAAYGPEARKGILMIYTKGYRWKGSPQPPEVMAEGYQKPTFSQVEQPARIDQRIWREFLAKNLNFRVGNTNKIPAGKYTMQVKFVVETDGSISNFEPVTRIGYGLEQEVLRIMKFSPKWEPAYQNGKPVRSSHVQPFTFIIKKQENSLKQTFLYFPPINESK
jgi:N-acetylmuramoyl-L-alanine amidase